MVSFASIQSLTFKGNLYLSPKKLSNINIAAEQFSATTGGSTYSAKSITSRIREINFNDPLVDQLSETIFDIEDIVTYGPSLTAPEAIIKVAETEKKEKSST